MRLGLHSGGCRELEEKEWIWPKYIVSVCLSSLSIAVIKHRDQKQPEKESVYLACLSQLLSIMNKNQCRNSTRAGIGRLELKQRWWRNTSHWLPPLPHFQQHFLYLPGPRTMGCILPQWALSKKMFYRLASGQSYRGIISQCKYPFR